MSVFGSWGGDLLAILGIMLRQASTVYSLHYHRHYHACVGAGTFCITRFPLLSRGFRTENLPIELNVLQLLADKGSYNSSTQSLSVF